MKKIINDIFKRKFKTRVKYACCGNLYFVQYCNYRIIPIWFNITYFNYKENWILKSECGWHNILTLSERAEEFAKRFNSMDDIDSWYKEEYILELRYIKDKINKKPYNSKIITN